MTVPPRPVGFVLVVLLLLVGFPVRTDAADQAVPKDRPVRILLVGDSVTQGSAGDWTWRYRLWKHLRASGVDADFVGPRDDLFDNVAAVQGSHDYVDPAFDQDHAARWGMQLRQPDQPVSDLVRTYRPDVVIVMLGINDLAFKGADPGELATELGQWVTDARAVDPSVDVLLGKPTQTWGSTVPEFNRGIDRLASEMSTSASRVAGIDDDQGYVEYVDTWDQLHPNARGEQKIAAATADALASIGIGAPYPRPLAELPVGPRAGALLEGVAGDRGANLTWNGPPGATGEIIWLRDVSAGTGWARSGDERSGASATLSDLTNGHAYDVVLQPVKGVDPAADDVRSNVLRLVPLPPSPSAPAVEVDVFGSATLAWADGGGSSVVEERDLTAGAGWRRVATGTSPATIGGLVPGHLVAFRVRAVRDGVESAPSPEASAIVPLLGAPGPLRVVRRHGVTVTGASAPGATQYRLDVSPVRSCRSALTAYTARRTSSTLSFRVTGRARDVRVRVVALRDGVEGAPSPSRCIRLH